MRNKWLLIFAGFLVVLQLVGCNRIDEGITAEPTQPAADTHIAEEETEAAIQEMRLIALDARDAADCSYEEFGTAECTYWKNPDEDYRAPQTMTVTFNGKTYTGVYKDTRITVPRAIAHHVYKFEGGKFGVRADDNQLVSFDNWDAPNGSLSQEACENIAASFVSQYADVSQYELETDVVGGSYLFFYYRYINGVRTADFIYVAVSNGGVIENFALYAIGAFSESNLRSDEAKRTIEVLSSEKADEALSEKIDAIYTSGFEKRYPGAKVTCTYTCSRNYLVSLPDGTFGRLYEGTVEAQIEKETGAARDSALFRILVKCE